MTLVPDASVLLAALLDGGSNGRWAESVIGDHDLVAPDQVVLETMNVLRRLERSGDITRLEANVAQRDANRLVIELLPAAPFAERIWSLRHNLTSYDAAYVAIAEALDVPMATLDTRLVGSAEAGTAVNCTFIVP